MRLFFLLFLTVVKPSFSCEKDFHIVSDFDDTIKSYKSESVLSKLKYALFLKQIFPGMGELYNGMVKNGSGNCKSDFTLLSASPKILNASVKSLLKIKKFPEADIILRRIYEDTYSYKTRVLQEINTQISAPMILIGDDTSYDHIVYQEFKENFPDEVYDIYVHNVKNKPKLPGQVVYITSYEIALNEYLKDRLDQDVVLEVGEVVLNASSLFIIPKYSYCPTNFSLAKTGEMAIDNMTEKIEKHILAICIDRERFSFDELLFAGNN